jgi:predicted small secreted protein
MKKLSKTILAVAVLVSLFALSGCNTFRGMGQDVESLGESMQSAGE